jgi:YVTN family beta-propeller protein
MRTRRRTGFLRMALVVFAAGFPATASAQSFTIVTTPASGSLAVVDLTTNAVVATSSLGSLPGGLAARGSRVFVALTDANSLGMIDIGSGELQSLAVGAGPAGVAVGDGALRVYVANAGDDTVSVVDPRKRVLLATIPVGHTPIDLVADDHRVYVANSAAGTISVIDTAAGAVIATIPVGTFPAGLAVHGRTKRLYVANFFDDTISVIDTAALSVVSTIPVARRPRGLALDTRGQRLFVAGFEDGRIQVVDTAAGTIALEGTSGGLNPLGLMLGPRDTTLYVANLQEHDGVVALDAATLAQVGSVDTPAGPVAFAGVLSKPPVVPSTPPLVSTARALVNRLYGAVRGATAGPVNAEAAVTDIVISDTEFDLADWAVTSNGEQVTTQETTGGNPGAWRSTTHFSPASDVVTTHRLVRAGSAYNPSTQGAIAIIDASWDSRLVNTESFLNESFVVEQGGVVYRTSERAVFLSATWTSGSRIGLVADDFSDSGGGHPDFSASGGILHFGYARHSLFSATATHGIDNFLVAIHSGAPNSAGRFRFEVPFLAVDEGDSRFVSVQRVGGTNGAVSVELHIERPDGTTSVETLSWSDGDSSDKSSLLLSLDLPDGSGARTARLTLQNPTGGGEIDASRGSMAILVFPSQWPEILRQLFLRVQVFLSTFSPAWLLILTVAAIVAWRARRRVPSR